MWLVIDQGCLEMEAAVFVLLRFKASKLKNYILLVELISEMASMHPWDFWEAPQNYGGLGG